MEPTVKPSAPMAKALAPTVPRRGKAARSARKAGPSTMPTMGPVALSSFAAACETLVPALKPAIPARAAATSTVARPAVAAVVIVMSRRKDGS